MTIFQQALSGARLSAVSALKPALAIIAAALAIASVACEDAQPSATPAPIAAAPALPTIAPAPPTATPTAIPTSTPAPPTSTPTAIPTNEPTDMWLPTALPESYDDEPTTPSVAPSWRADEWIPTALPAPTTPTVTPIPPAAAPIPSYLFQSGTPAPTPTSTTAEGSRLIYEYAVDAMNGLSSYRLRMNMILAVGGLGRISRDSYKQPPDLEKSKVTVGGGSNKPVETESIVAGAYTYTKPSVNLFPPDDPNRGRWIREYTGDESTDEFEGGLLSEIGVDELVGLEWIDDAATIRLKGSVDLESGFGITPWAGADDPMKVHIWVGEEDNLIRRITAVADPAAGGPQVGVTMIFSDFDAPVDVEAPKDYIDLDSEQLPDTPSYAPDEITRLSSGWTRAHLPDYGFSVSTPPDWFINHPDTPRQPAADAALDLRSAMIQHVFPGQITAYEGDETRVSVFSAIIIGTSGDIALSEYVDERLEHTEAALVIDGAIARRAEALPAGEAERVEFTFRFPYEVFDDEVFGDTVFGMDYEDDTDYAQIQYFILAQGDAFILTFAATADRIDAMRPVFEDIAQTARIEPRP